MKTLTLMKIVADAPQSVRHQAIGLALKASGSSFAQVARDMGLTRAAVLHVRHRSYPSVEAVIARTLAVKPWELWPDRYDGGVPIRQRPNREWTRPEARRAL